jgi:hypothetical protein
MRPHRGERTTRAWLGLSTILAAVPGCSSNADPGGPFSLTVLTSDATGTTVGLAGVAVAVDEFNGKRFEATTDATGVATFAHVDISGGPFSFTAALAGYVVVTDEGLTQTGAWHTTLEKSGEDPSWADVSGIVTGKLDENDDVFVSATVPATGFFGVGPEYAIRVTPGAAYSFIVAEAAPGPTSSMPAEAGRVFRQWTKVDERAAEGVEEADLMISVQEPEESVTELLSQQTQGTLDVPSTMVGADAFMQVTTLESGGNAYLGGMTSVNAVSGAANQLAYTAEFVDPIGDYTFQTVFWLERDGASTSTFVDGVPIADPLPMSFLDPPVLQGPASMYGDLVLHDVAPEAATQIAIETDDETSVWRIYTQGTAVATVHMPRLPSAIDPRVVLGTGRVAAVPEVCVIDSSGRCSQFASGAAADLVAP